MTNTTQAASHAKLFQTILASIRFEKTGNQDEEAAARVQTDILVALADVLREPAPEVAGVELVADGTQEKILAELVALNKFFSEEKVVRALSISPAL